MFKREKLSIVEWPKSLIQEYEREISRAERIDEQEQHHEQLRQIEGDDENATIIEENSSQWKSSDISILSEPVLHHLIYATSNLEDTLDELENTLGIRPTMGSSQHGIGIRDAHLDLGASGVFLEIVAKDETQVVADPSTLPFGLGHPEVQSTLPRIVGWAAVQADGKKTDETSNLEVAHPTSAIYTGDIEIRPESSSPFKPDRANFNFLCSKPKTGYNSLDLDLLVPYQITCPSKPDSLKSGCELVTWFAYHKYPDIASRFLKTASIELPEIKDGKKKCSISAVIRTPTNGIITLT